MDILKRILDCSRRFDIEAHDSPVMLYTCAERRTCQDPLDRIYAIMQVFGFKLGASRDPTRIYTLPDLELEFGVALNNRSPLNAQLFTHLRPAVPTRSWMITQHCRIPDIFQFGDVVLRSTCSIGPNQRGQISYKGRSCSFASISARWLAFGNKGVRSGGFWAWKKAVQIVVLDHSSFNTARVEPRMLKLEGTAPIEESDIHNEILHMMLSWRDEDLGVLQLGRLLRRFGDGIFASDSSQEADDPEDAEDGNVGLVVRKVEHSEAVSWERVGVAVWRQLDDDDDNHSAFTDDELLLC